MSRIDMYNRLVEALLAKEYPQQSLLNPSNFNSFARKRGIDVSIGNDDFETWDRLEILSPMIKLRRPSSYHLITERLPDGVLRYDPQPLEGDLSDNEDVVRLYGAWNLWSDELRANRDQALIYPSADTFQRWSSLQDNYLPTVDLLYHPYQIFRLREVYHQSLLSFRLTSYSVSEEDWNEHFRFTAELLERSLAHLHQNDDAYLKIMILFLLIEDRYLPDLREYITYPNPGLRTDHFKDWYEWADTFDPEWAYHESGYTIEEIKKIRQDFAIQGYQFIDPNSDWFLLIRHATREQRQKLKKEALLAWDYYEVVEMLGRFLKDLTGEYQPLVDDLVALGNVNWKKRLYGVAADQIDYDQGNVLPAVLRHFGLDPRVKVLFIVEGDSEVAFIEKWCEKRDVDFGFLSIRLVPLDGVGGLKNFRVRQYLRDALNDGACTVLSVDDEQDSVESLRDLVHEGLLEKIFEVSDLGQQDKLAIGAILWKPCFEDANFTFDELLDSWIKLIDASQTNQVVDSEKLKGKVRERHDFWGKTAIKSIEEVANRFHLRFSKLDIARLVAEQFSESDKPVILLLENVVRLALSARTARYEPPHLTSKDG